MPNPIAHRYDFVYLFDVTDGNPNGDPDAGNLPRLDPETGQGLVTDVCLKRKIRNYLALLKEDKAGYDLFVRERAVLNDQIERAYYESKKVRDLLKQWNAWKSASKKKRESGDVKEPKKHIDDVAAQWMCENFFDIRFFGAVLTTGKEKQHEDIKAKIKMTAGQVRGPIQFGISRSIDPIFSAEHALTRCAVTNEADVDKERTMGRKFTVPYALYRVHGYINAKLAAQTGFSEDDLDLFKKALDQMFEHDRSAARGNMAPRGCVAFKHDHALGNARADQLFRRVSITSAKENGAPPRSFEDYTVSVDEADLPEGVTIEHWVEP